MQMMVSFSNKIWDEGKCISNTGSVNAFPTRALANCMENVSMAPLQLMPRYWCPYRPKSCIVSSTPCLVILKLIFSYRVKFNFITGFKQHGIPVFLLKYFYGCSSDYLPSTRRLQRINAGL